MIPLKKQLEDWNWKTSRTTNSPLKSKETMKYDITKHTAPTMPTLGKGTECIKILLSQTSKDMHEPLVPMLFPPLGAHMSGSEFQYPDLTWKETCGQMANLVSDTGGNKGQSSLLVEAKRGTWLHFSRRAICRDFRVHDSGRNRRNGIVDIGSILPFPYPRLTSSLPAPCRPRRCRENPRRT